MAYSASDFMDSVLAELRRHELIPDTFEGQGEEDPDDPETAGTAAVNAIATLVEQRNEAQRQLREYESDLQDQAIERSLRD
jgi:hypothetical protein